MSRVASERCGEQNPCPPLNAGGINAVFHYGPLHVSRAGRRFACTVEQLPQTASIAERLIGLPMWIGMTEREVEHAATIVGRTIG